MVAYSIDYTIRGKDRAESILIDARDIKSAKRKIGKKHGYKNGRMVKIHNVIVCGYY